MAKEYIQINNDESDGIVAISTQVLESIATLALEEDSRIHLAKEGKVSCIVPMVSHMDHTIKSTQILITEQGVADLRGLDVVERANLIIEKCAHPKFRPALKKYLAKATVLSDYLAYPYSAEAAMMFHNSDDEE